ncbi:MAG: DUF3883 domain-containing protein [Deltaproteobacteria bacterium]|nr:DUF3883 domain-containing protein [Deltaproteobacteria bacterium]
MSAVPNDAKKLRDTAPPPHRAAEDPRARIIDKTVGELRTFIAELGNGTTLYRTVHGLTEQVEHQCHGRFVIELLQNAHDALLADAAVGCGRVEIALEAGPDGAALYVANDGRPFFDEDFLAIARLGQSSKDPAHSVGYKGLGFRSVLEVCDAPEIYSRDPYGVVVRDDAPRFDGYCFRFSPRSIEAVMQALFALLDGGEEAQLSVDDMSFSTGPVDAGRYRERVGGSGLDPAREARLLSPYLLPLPASARSSRVLEYAARGFSTLVRLPLRDDAARATARDRIAEVNEETILFLHGLEHLALRVEDQPPVRFHKTVTPRPGFPECTVRIERKGRADAATFRVWERVAGGEDDAQVAEIAAAVVGLPEIWSTLRKVPLAVAVRTDRPTAGLFFIHLPTLLLTGVDAHLHAPFYGDLSRKSVDWEIRINALFLRYLLGWVDEIIRDHLAGGEVADAQAIVELLAPREPAGLVAMQPLYPGFVDVPLLLTDRGWRCARGSRLVPRVDRSTLLDDDCLRHHAAFAALHRELDPRRDVIAHLLRRLGHDGAPTDAELAATLENVAEWLHARPDDKSQRDGVDWARFWDETEQLLPGQRARALVDRRVLLSQQGALLASPSKGSGPRVFFPPVQGDDEMAEAAEVGGASSVDVPTMLRERIAFLSERIPLHHISSAGRRQTTTARKYLEGALVDVYSADRILRSVVVDSLPTGEVMAGTREATLCSEALDFALRIIKSSRQRDTLVPLLKDLRVPCLGGWHVARDAAFGPGWKDRGGEALLLLLEEAGTPEAAFERERLLLPPDDPAWSGHGATLGPWLEQAGVARGLRLRPFEGWSGRCWLQRGYSVNLSHAPRGVATAHWTAYRADCQGRFTANFAGCFEYEWEGQQGVAALDRIDQLSAAGREALTTVLLHSLACWEPSWVKSSLRKLVGYFDRIPGASFLRHALADLPWIWVAEETRGARPSDLWFVAQVIDRGQARQFDHLHPAPAAMARTIQQLPERLAQTALAALDALGMPRLDFEHHTSDPRLLDDLAASLVDQRLDPSNRSVFLGQVRYAWAAFEPATPPRLPRRYVVLRGGKGPLPFEPTDADPFYVPDSAPRGLDQSPLAALPVLVVAPADAWRLLPRLRDALGERVRALSSMQLDPCRGEEPWESAPGAPRLDESPLAWLVPLALTVSAFAVGQYGTQTRQFQKALATLRAVRLHQVAGLSVRTRGLGEGCVVAQPSLWHPELNSLLYDATSQGWLQSLAGPLQLLLARNDLLIPLRLALARLDEHREPEREELLRALAALEITPEQYEEVRQRCVGDLGWVVERLRPALALLRPDFDLAELASVDSTEALTDRLAPLLDDPPAAWLVEQAQKSRDHRSMGLALWQRIGATAELAAWNAAVRQVEPEHCDLENGEWLRQLQAHRDSAMTPLRAMVRWVCRRDGRPADYLTMTRSLEEDRGDSSLASTHWEVPFLAAMRGLRGAFDRGPGSEPSIEALDAAADVDALFAAIERLLPGAEPRVDPSLALRDSVDRCRRLWRELQETALASRAKRGQAAGPWAQPSEPLLTVVLKPLQDGAGYLSPLDDAGALARLREDLAPLIPDETFWNAVEASASPEMVRERLGVTAQDLKLATELLTRAQQEQLRRARLTAVCGGEYDPQAPGLGAVLWNDLTRLAPDNRIGDLDPRDCIRLTPFDREKFTGGGKAGGRGVGAGKAGRLNAGQERLVGLAGEMLALRLLGMHFGEAAVGPSALVSENSVAVFPDNAGRVDDTLGYDFKVVQGRTTWYIEVKTTLSDQEQFELGSSQIRAALRFADGRHELFRILHIRNMASTPTARFLPNPYDRVHRGDFLIDEAGLRVRYREAAGGDANDADDPTAG